MGEQSDTALRVYVDPDPPSGSHRGFRGTADVIVETEYGVRVKLGAECLWCEVGDYDSEWFEVEVESLVPWHRVHSIEFTPATESEVPRA